MSVILLRVRGGLDYSAHIVDEELVEPEVMMIISEIIVIVIVIAIIVNVTTFTFLRICSLRTTF